MRALDTDNGLIERLPPRLRTRLLPHCALVDLTRSQVLFAAGQPYRNVYFPRSGAIALLSGVSGHAPVVVGLVGREAMLGASLAVGEPSSALWAVVHVEGQAWRMSAQRFRRELSASPPLERAALAALRASAAQMIQAVPCMCFHPLQARLALWLLRTADRIWRDTMPFTHQFLAEILGVRRSAVTLSAGQLQRLGLIRYARGILRIVDRTGLRRVACACYGCGLKAVEPTLARGLRSG